MKKTYIIPEMNVTASISHSIMDLSREISGGPKDEGMPGTVGETDGELDPYDGHGQGTGGSGNRAPERWGSLW